MVRKLNGFYTAVIFDLDGTLVNTIDDITDAMNYVLQKRGFPLHHANTYMRFIGDGIEDFVRRALPIHHRDNNGIDECVEEMRSRYARLWKRKSRPYSGIETLLSILQDSGLKLGILSNKPDDFTREMVAYIFHQYHFESVKGAVQGTPKKPDPTGAIAIAEQMKTTPDHCIYIGDSEVDIQTAKNAGMVSVGVTWGFRTRDDLVKNGAEIIIDEPEQLIPVLHHISAKS